MSVYLTRTDKEQLRPDLGGAEDRLFVNQRFENETLPEGLYFRCTFANVSFLRSRLEHVRFSACVFEGCYFRETTFNKCRFSGTRFIDCDFVKPNILGCDFRYARFRGCFPPFDEMEASLPGEHNMSADLASNLASEARAAGDGNEARRYLLKAIREHEQHLLAGFQARTQYYKDHFPRSLDRVFALWRVALSRANGFLWGYGERGYPLLRTVLGIAFVVWPLLFVLTRGSIDTSAGHHVNLGDCIWLSVASIVGNSAATGFTTVGFARALVLSEGAIGLLLLGLFVTYLYRYVTRR
jgi:hypothetical protein